MIRLMVSHDMTETNARNNAPDEEIIIDEVVRFTRIGYIAFGPPHAFHALSFRDNWKESRVEGRSRPESH